MHHLYYGGLLRNNGDRVNGQRCHIPGHCEKTDFCRKCRSHFAVLNVSMTAMQNRNIQYNVKILRHFQMSAIISVKMVVYLG